MSCSEDLSRAFYAELGADGLARRTRPDLDRGIVALVLELLPPTGRVLDVGCGYGRIALPLARAGYAVEGFDLSPNLLDAARRSALAEHLDITLRLGTMKQLPYESESFDAAISLWSAFNELLEEDEQVRSLREISRVLRRGGLAVLEGRGYEEPLPAEIAAGQRRGPEYRVDWSLIDGILAPHYRHDEKSLRQACAQAGIERFDVRERAWGERQRLVLRIDKP